MYGFLLIPFIVWPFTVFGQVLFPCSGTPLPKKLKLNNVIFYFQDEKEISQSMNESTKTKNRE